QLRDEAPVPAEAQGVGQGEEGFRRVELSQRAAHRLLGLGGVALDEEQRGLGLAAGVPGVVQGFAELGRVGRRRGVGRPERRQAEHDEVRRVHAVLPPLKPRRAGRGGLIPRSGRGVNPARAGVMVQVVVRSLRDRRKKPGHGVTGPHHRKLYITPAGRPYSSTSGSGGPSPPLASSAATVAARAWYAFATGESGYLWTMGSPWSPHSVTRGSMGSSPRN